MFCVGSFRVEGCHSEFKMKVSSVVLAVGLWSFGFRRVLETGFMKGFGRRAECVVRWALGAVSEAESR